MLRIFQAFVLIGFHAAGWSQKPVAVIESIVMREPIAERVEVVATVMAAESVSISASVADVVSQIHLQEGATVAAGELLLELRHAEEQAALLAAKASLREKRSALGRVQELQQQNLASPAELELAQAALDAARADVQEHQAILDDYFIRAPFAGTLGLRDVAPGQYVSPGQPLIRLHDLSALRLEFTLAQTDLARLGAPLSAVARLPQSDTTYALNLNASAGELDPRTRSLRLRARLSEIPAGLQPGSVVLVEVSGPARDALFVPEAALIGGAEGQTVFVNVQGQARREIVRTGQRRAGVVEIIEGLSEGDRVIVHGGNKLRPGGAVHVLGVFDGSRPLAELIKATDTRP